jgi:hypothetical protein
VSDDFAAERAAAEAARTELIWDELTGPDAAEQAAAAEAFEARLARWCEAVADGLEAQRQAGPGEPRPRPPEPPEPG